MYLKKVDIKEFKKVIYEEYKNIFPKEERKTYTDLERSYNNKITDIFKIVDNEQFIGFIITNFLENNPIVQLDYFAILPKYQNKGYGTNAIKLLKERYKEYDAIFIEIEKVGYGNNNLENKMRKRRANFYENLGFCKMMFDLNLYKIIYSAYILTCSNNVLKEEVVIENIFEIYKSILGEKKVEKNCKVLF